MQVAEICAQIEATFPRLFEAQEGRICLLFVCSELLRMIERYEDHPMLKEPLEGLAARVLGILGNTSTDGKHGQEGRMHSRK